MENEVELINGCRGGKESARKRLYTLYSKKMIAVCYRYTGDIDSAHDVMHDAFVKIFTNFNFNGDCTLSTWITRVIVNQALDYLRQRRRMESVIVSEEQMPDVPYVDDNDGEEIPTDQLMMFVAELPEGCRTVFNLYVFEEKSHKEISNLLGIKEHSSTSQLHRAKCILAKRIKDYKENEERR